MLVGREVIAAGAAGRGAEEAPSLFAPESLATLVSDGFSRRSSLELQLEAPKAANMDSTRIVKASRMGVHNGFSVLVLSGTRIFDFTSLLRTSDQT
jgi:hypothetical protein